MRLRNNKRGFVSIPLLLMIALIVLLVFGGASLLVWVLSQNIWQLTGIIIIALVGTAWIMRVKLPQKVQLTALIVGGVLALLPFIFNLT
jgi:FtsH-binding integral membrane protein